MRAPKMTKQWRESTEVYTQLLEHDYFEHREPCECPACQAGAYCIREIERVAGNCGE